MKLPILLSAFLVLYTSCNKTVERLPGAPMLPADSGQFIKYTIQEGHQYCDGNSYKPIELTEMKFTVRFDSSAIYETRSSGNQYDINKLYGFSDNGSDHHQYSARIGWRWSDQALRLFAYVYNEGIVSSKELAEVAIGPEISCSVKPAGPAYIFVVNGNTTAIPRKATTAKGRGYQLYPYFGGDEAAPHRINIWIRTEPSSN